MNQELENIWLTVPEVANDPAISSSVKKFLASINSGAAGLETLPVKDAREALSAIQAAVTFDYSGISEMEREIVADGYALRINVVRPVGATGNLPAFVFVHGGGWVLGDYPTHKRMLRDLVLLTGAAGIFLNYTRSPEARYPQAVNEIYAATKWVAQHGAEIHVDGSRLAIVGNSVGGNMAAVTALKALENNGPTIKGLVLFWPIVAAEFDNESYERFGKDRFLTTALMKWMYNHYTKDEAQRQEIYASPINATLKQLKGFPPTLIQVAEADVLRDEGEAFGRKLDEAGVTVTTVRYNGMIHDFGLLNPLAELPQVKTLFRHAAAELNKYLW